MNSRRAAREADVVTAGRVIALLRGVNVGKGRKVSMAELRAALAASGWTDVATYIQSGNVVGTPPHAVRGTGAGEDVRRVVHDVSGLDVAVVIRTAAELKRTVARNPFPSASGTTLHVVFFAEPPDRKILAAVDLEAAAPEEMKLVGRDLYLHLPNGMGRAKLPALLERAGRAARARADLGTARNWNTVLELVRLAEV